MHPSALAVAALAAPRLAAGEGVDAALAAPHYVRDKVAFTREELERSMSAVLKSAELVPMREDDLADVVDIESAIYTHPWTRGNFADSLRAGYECHTYRMNGELIGYFVLMVAVGEAHLLNLSIAAAYQRRGHGTRLLEEATRLARVRGAANVFLEVRPSNRAAQDLYTAMAFAGSRYAAIITPRIPGARTRSSLAIAVSRRSELLAEMGLAPVWRLRKRQESGAGVARLAEGEWITLKQAVPACTACGLHKTRTQTVFGVGDEKADWMLIGEAPGAEEDRLGDPFVGQAGKLLDNMLRAIEPHARRERLYRQRAQMPAARQPQSRARRSRAVHAVSAAQIALIQPKLIVAMGRFAAQTLLDTDASIASLRGRVHQLRRRAADRHLSPGVSAAQPPGQGEGLGRPALREEDHARRSRPAMPAAGFGAREGEQALDLPGVRRRLCEYQSCTNPIVAATNRP